MDNYIGKVETWLKENQIQHHSGTWLHKVGLVIHLLGRLTCLLPQPKLKHRLKPVYVDLKLMNRVAEKYDLYKKLATKNNHIDANGFIDSGHCDSTLFTGLLSFCGLYKVDLTKARDSDDFWHRRDALRPCYPDHSKSSFSRDMMLGVLWWLFATRNLGVAESLYRHTKKHQYVMGLGDPSRLLLMPGLEATLAEIVARLGGKKHRTARRMFQLWPLKQKGYRAHLSVCHGLLRGIVMGGVTDKMLRSFHHYAKENPQNPLYQLAYALFSDGDCNKAASLLLEESIWPNDRLPKRKDRKSSWVTQRSSESDWLPASDGDLEQEHSGGDFLHVAGIMVQLYNR